MSYSFKIYLALHVKMYQKKILEQLSLFIEYLKYFKLKNLINKTHNFK